MKWIVIVLGALALLVVVVAVIGMALPEDPMATASRSVQGTPEDGDI